MKLCRVLNQVVGGKDKHHRLRVLPYQDMGGQRNRRRRISLHGFRQNLLPGELGDVLPCLRRLFFIGDDIDFIFRNESPKTVHRLLEKGSGAEHLQELFGAVAAAERPKARSLAAGHDDGVERTFRMVSLFHVE